MKETLAILGLEGYEPEAGAALWRLEDSRSRTLALLKDLPEELLDRETHGNTIGTILYHIALVEADWLYSEILQEPIPQELLEEFPVDIRDTQGLLSYVRDQSLDQHLARLKHVRSLLLERLHGMTDEDYHRLRCLPNYDVSPDWVLHHITQHEDEHRGELGSILTFIKTRP
jgi:uncharacterized damage-inducible protein DinB